MKKLDQKEKKMVVLAMNKMIEHKKWFIKNRCTNCDGTLNFAGEAEQREITEYERVVNDMVNIKNLRQRKEVWI